MGRTWDRLIVQFGGGGGGGVVEEVEGGGGRGGWGLGGAWHKAL